MSSGGDRCVFGRRVSPRTAVRFRAAARLRAGASFTGTFVRGALRGVLCAGGPCTGAFVRRAFVRGAFVEVFPYGGRGRGRGWGRDHGGWTWATPGGPGVAVGGPGDVGRTGPPFRSGRHWRLGSPRPAGWVPRLPGGSPGWWPESAGLAEPALSGGLRGDTHRRPMPVDRPERAGAAPPRPFRTRSSPRPPVATPASRSVRPPRAPAARSGTGRRRADRAGASGGERVRRRDTADEERGHPRGRGSERLGAGRSLHAAQGAAQALGRGVSAATRHLVWAVDVAL